MVLKRAVKAVVFWGVLLASVSNGLSTALAGDPPAAVAAATAAGMLVVVFIWGAILHRLIYGRVFGRGDLRKLSPIRPAETAE